MPDHPDESPRATTRTPTECAIVALVVFVIALEAHRIVAAIPGYVETVGAWPEPVRWLLTPARWLVLILIGLAVVGVSPARAARELGLAVRPRSALLALAFALACSAPMLALGIAGGTPEVQRILLKAAVLAPLAEEILFRGYAFGQLVRRGRWGVWPAALVTGVIFGALHLLNAEIQAHELPGRALSVGLIAAGGVAYAWLFHRWGMNLWIAIGLHAFMNLWYALFAIEATPIGSTWLIASRVAVVAIAITATEVWRRRPAART